MMKKNCAIVLAAGKGRRMGAEINKQFLKLRGKPVLYYTLKVFEKNKNIDEIVLVVAKKEIDYCKENIVKKYNFNKIVSVVEGGNERQHSVLNGLNALNNCNIVIIHDGARPFLTERIIDEGIAYAKEYCACACGVTPKDTIKVIDKDNFCIDTPNRKELFCVQTPQCFKYDLILDSHIKINKAKMKVTDDTMVVEKCGHKVYLYNGDYKNIKITTPEDMVIGEKILETFNLDIK
jgi:2-C-methyl-D-erythritol 4-phosphate cytidylyltransferase